MVELMGVPAVMKSMLTMLISVFAVVISASLYAQTASNDYPSNKKVINRTCGIPETTSRQRVSFEDVKNGVLFLRTDQGAGSGFLLSQDGKKYLVTNLHVIEDATRIAAFFYGGDSLPLGRLDIDANNDLARFEVETDKPGFAPCGREPSIGEEVFIYGDSQGAGVLTEIKGRIIGVGPLDVETDAHFIQGNSGSALLNANMEVVGVATYMKMRRDAWNEETRFGNVRRFAVRLNCAKWQPSSIKELIKKREEEAMSEIVSVIVSSYIQLSYEIFQLEYEI